MNAVAPRRGPLRLHPVPLTAAQNRWTLRRWFAVGATVVAVLSLVAVGLGAWAVVRIGDARDQLFDKVSPAVSSAQNVNAGLVDQETGLRGFTLKPDPVFLEPYLAGIRTEADAAARLRGIEALPEQQTYLATLTETERLADQWRREYAEPTIAAAQAGLPVPDPTQGRLLFDRVRASAAGLIADVDRSRAIARGQLDSAITFVAVVGIVITVVAAVFLLLASLGLRSVILRPLRGLAAQTRSVVDGDMGSEIQGSGPREIVALGADVEAMRAHIQREVDELHEANAKLDERTLDLERSNRDLEQFAYVASHDLQEPLRKVSSFCQLLQRRYGGQLDDRADQYIGFAVDGAQRMQRLINDLLSFSRVGRTTSGFEPVDLGAVAHTAADQLATAVEEAGGEIVLPPDLPTVTGDAGLLQALLVNLFGNGVKFHRPDVSPVVRLSAVRHGEEWEIAVADNGIGIEPEYVDKIFVIFQRLHGRDVYAGTGIGLALAKKIVEFHGGRIWVDHGSSDEPGTTFRLTLPVAQSAPEPQLAKEPSA
ncbi:sensor histidine kinase [Pseudonocardia xishanensis]|uniref:histidine kinase n=1 Tax=Pseudonocardia xishanensis TaxID=630995 RepID=A0ABP8RN50_9PSEU